MSTGVFRIGGEGGGASKHGRRGGVGDQLVYGIGDVHGCYALLKSLLARLAEDVSQRANGRRPTFVFCGDYVDRGPASAKVVEALVWLQQRPDIDLHLLKGNHEQAMLEFIETPEQGGAWLRYGGAETLLSYGVLPPEDETDAAALAQARNELLERMPASHLRLLEGLELMVEIGGYVFVHAGIRPKRALARQQEEDLLWIRQGFIDAPGPHEKIVVHGHTWHGDEPQLLEHRIGLDTGAYATGVLTAARFENESFEIIQVRQSQEAVSA